VLADFQEALARLLVDADLRAVHARGSSIFSHRMTELDLELDPAELASLVAIPPAQLERVASSLAHKRRRAAEATVPHSARLWPELGERYLELLAVAPARVEELDPALGPGASELLRCLPQLRTAARREGLIPPWTADLLALELARACSRRDLQPRSLRCAYPVHRALAALDEGWLSVELEPGACEYLLEGARLRWRPTEQMLEQEPSS
jgi:hypothetical protein